MFYEIAVLVWDNSGRDWRLEDLLVICLDEKLREWQALFCFVKLNYFPDNMSPLCYHFFVFYYC